MKKRKLTVYLAGAMEASADLGSGWRSEISPFLESLNFEVLNPCNFEPHQLKGLQPNRLPEYYTDNLTCKQIKPKHWHELKNASEKHLYDRFLKYMRRIVQYDMNLVNNGTNVLIVLWNEEAAKGAGTHAEVTAAYLKNIPIYCVAECDIPAWLKACMSEICLDFEALKATLTEDFGG